MTIALAGSKSWSSPFKNMKNEIDDRRRDQYVQHLLQRHSLVLIGLMGAGKSAIGRRLAARLDVPFLDADNEIETAAGKSIAEIFTDDGEEYFRDREEKVIERLLIDGPLILATGGGAFMSEATRQAIKAHGLSLWLNADLDILMERVSRRSHRPLLQTEDPRAVMKSLMDQRYPVYATADITILSRDVLHEVIVEEILSALYDYGHSRKI